MVSTTPMISPTNAITKTVPQHKKKTSVLFNILWTGPNQPTNISNREE